jgi:hypothetical protein
MQRTGGCLCGDVRYTAQLKNTDLGACHCGMCRKWAGGPFIVATTASIDFDAESPILAFASSKWAERGSCARCGSSLFYRLVGSGQTMVAAGSLDDLAGLQLAHEIFTDKRPAAWCFAGDLHGETEAEVWARVT